MCGVVCAHSGAVAWSWWRWHMPRFLGCKHARRALRPGVGFRSTSLRQLHHISLYQRHMTACAQRQARDTFRAQSCARASSRSTFGMQSLVSRDGQEILCKHEGNLPAPLHASLQRHRYVTCERSTLQQVFSAQPCNLHRMSRCVVLSTKGPPV